MRDTLHNEVSRKKSVCAQPTVPLLFEAMPARPAIKKISVKFARPQRG
jgi:hypothetical protein